MRHTFLAALALVLAVAYFVGAIWTMTLVGEAVHNGTVPGPDAWRIGFYSFLACSGAQFIVSFAKD